MINPSFPTFSNIPNNSTFNSSYQNYSYSSQANFQPSSTLTRSRILQQNRYAPNEQLYSPLKTAISTNVNDTFRFESRQGEFMEAARKSRVISEYRPVTQMQVQNIRNNTFMIEEPLRPTSNYEKVQGKQFMVLNSNQRLEAPINEAELRNRLSKSQEKEVIVYEPSAQVESKGIPTSKFEEIKFGPLKQKKTPVAKYNLYSCLDEPFERVKMFGCKGLTCPANQCIAATRKKDWLE